MAINKLEINFEATNEILSLLNTMGRTEDLAFSPNNSKLVIASSALNKVVIFDIEIKLSNNEPRIVLTNTIEINSLSITLPHGITWINDDTIIVANRNGNATVFKIPNPENINQSITLAALQSLPHIKGTTSDTTDCIDAHSLGLGLYEIFICSNAGNYVSHYILDESENFAVKASAFLLKKDIYIPDGVKLSQDGKWLAISNHEKHQVFVYKNTQPLNCSSLPNATLHGTNYPHGVTFSTNQQFIFVADAGGPFVYVYHNSANDWNGDYFPCATIRIMDDETFKLGHTNKQEGGAKGISITQDSSLIATTCGTKPLAFFYVKDLIKSMQQTTVEAPQEQTKNIEDQVIKSLLRITENMKITANELTIAHQHQIDLLKNSHSWRITSPLRKIKILAVTVVRKMKLSVKF